ncbi:uracil-DNA glycosylase [Aliiroseovarius sp.]|uniref:uracil-DNA glycosylase n=1 Tax=Aliiroseovarius sp. TaxID=1872442 RepID=UPI00260AB3A3|nr:uracil-DNA glycosylase [Aliiroseovarius sp.]
MTPQGIGAWGELPFFTDHWPGIARALGGETRQILPPDADRFRALELTRPEDTRVVILGQDPYPTPGDANGLAFSVSPGTPLPRSLRNIFAELETDLGQLRLDGDLSDWACQGVLLLNTSLSVPAGEANAHKKLGWDHLVRQVLDHVSKRPTAFVLWGNNAQKLGKFIQPGGHLMVETAHPSPLSARRGFFGSRPFSRVNEWLTDRGDSPIDW